VRSVVGYAHTHRSIESHSKRPPTGAEADTPNAAVLALSGCSTNAQGHHSLCRTAPHARRLYNLAPAPFRVRYPHQCNLTSGQRTAPFTMPARCTPLAVETAAPAGAAAAAEPGAGAGAPAVPNSDVSKSMTSAALASDTVPAVACTRFSGGAPAGVAVACAAWARRGCRAARAVQPARYAARSVGTSAELTTAERVSPKPSFATLSGSSTPRRSLECHTHHTHAHAHMRRIIHRHCLERSTVLVSSIGQLAGAG